MTMNSRRRGVFLMGHGTKSQRGKDQFLELISLANQRFPIAVSGGFIELAEPEMNLAMDTFLEAEDLDELVVVPVVLFPAGHMKDDGPVLVARAKGSSRNKSLKVTYSSFLGTLPEVVTAISERIVESYGHTEASEDRAVLLVGRGSTDPDGNAELYKASRLVTEQLQLDPLSVQSAFVSLAPPSVPDALESLYKMGYREVVVQPYFLFHGLLIDRMFDQAYAWSKTHEPSPRLILGQEIGPGKLLLDAISYRVDQALGEITLSSCDLCMYRSPTMRGNSSSI